MSHVFDKVELLEHILLHLPLRGLLQVQRVSRHFHAVVHGSPPIQRVLFFKPLEASIRGTGGHPTYVKDKHTMPMNPFLANYLLYTGIKSHNAAVTYKTRPFEGAIDLSYTDPAASWRKMLVIQPAARPLSIQSDLAPTREASLESGLTMIEMLRKGNREGRVKSDAIPPRSTQFPWFEMRAARWDWWFSIDGLGHGRDVGGARSKLDDITGWDVLARTGTTKCKAQ